MELISTALDTEEKCVFYRAFSSDFHTVVEAIHDSFTWNILLYRNNDLE